MHKKTNTELCSSTGITVAVLALGLLGVPFSQAALVNRYTFNDGTVNDSVGGANGSVVGTGGVFTPEGWLDLTFNNGLNGTNAASTYVDLPNGIISSAVNSGVAGSFSFSLWFTVSSNRN